MAWFNFSPPSAVTTTVSSIRIPKLPGKYTPGSSLKVIPSADSAGASRWKVVDGAGHAVPRDRWPAARALRGEVVSPGIECEYTSSTGERTWYSVAAAPVRSDVGTVDNAVVVVQDIDRLKRASEALEEADRRKDQFLATLAHELRNPLAPIWNAVEILGRHDVPADRQDEASRVTGL